MSPFCCNPCGLYFSLTGAGNAVTMFATLVLVGHALSVVSFGALFILICIGRRASPFRSTILWALGGSIAWAVITLAASFYLQRPVLIPLLEWMKTVGWLWLTVRLLSAASPDRAQTYAGLAKIGIGIPLAGILGLTALSMFAANPFDAKSTNLIQAMTFMGMIVFGLTLLETLSRWMSEKGRHAARYYFISVGFLFAVDFFLFATMLLLGQIDATIFALRGIALACVPPMLLVALVRQRDWLVDVHISREVIVNAATLLGGSVYLLAMALAGFAVRELNVTWGPLLHLAFLAGAVLLLASIVSSEGIRPRLRAWVSRHFFSAKYDYRREWLRFSDALAMDSGRAAVEERVLQAVLKSLGCQSGGLWLRLEEDAGYALASAQPRSALFSDRQFEELTKTLASQRKPIALKADASNFNLPFRRPWAAAPIIHREIMVGYIVLAESLTAQVADEEDFELLNALCVQASAHLAEERSAMALGRARRFESTARRLTYVGHDLKNIVSQISLVLQNWTRHSDNPVFVQQMPDLLQGAVVRMKKLLDGLKDDPTDSLAKSEVVDLSRCINSMLPAWKARSEAIRFNLKIEGVFVAGSLDQYQSIFDQLVANAIDASSGHGAVEFSAAFDASIVWIEIKNSGAISGTDVALSRFGSLDSKKSDGYGVGLFQVRDYVRGLGGTLSFSTIGESGTLARIEFPMMQEMPSASISRLPRKTETDGGGEPTAARASS